MRIGVVTTSYPRWPGDAAGAFVEGHVRALRALGHDVDVIAAGDASRPERSKRQGATTPSRESEVDQYDRSDFDLGALASWRFKTPAHVVRVPGRGLFYRGGAPDLLERSPRWLDAAAFTAQLTFEVTRRAHRWDHVIAHWIAPSALAAIPARKPLTAIAHGGDVHTLRRMRLLAPAIALLRARDARLVFVSEALRAIANAPDALVQPMGVDLEHFAALGRAPTTPPTVLVAARLVPIKGVDTAIEAAARLPHVQLVIAGDGPERRALEARARHVSATFLGNVDTAHRDQLLRRASVVVVPSRTIAGRTEGCPTIAIEALAAGVPVVATIGRATEIVAADDPIVLATAIERAIASRPKTADLVADLGWRHVAERLLRKN
jgi:glycosyltransferase involved in cell wall biosynthesis